MITPKNWQEFQHYKDRKPAWIKLHRSLLDDYEFSRLPVASRALAPLLWLLASEYEDGKITCNEDALAFRLRMSLKELRVALNPLIENGFFMSDSTPLADCKQDASLEKERETQVKTEKNLVDLEFEKFKRAYPKRSGSQGWPTAKRFFDIAVRSGCPPADIIAASQKFEKSFTRDRIGTEFVPMAETWMRKGNWREFIPTEDDKRRAEATEKFLAERGYGIKDGENQ